MFLVNMGIYAGVQAHATAKFTVTQNYIIGA